MSFGSSGAGGSGHLASELFAVQAKSKQLQVPFKGNGPALLEVMAGRLDYMFYPVIGIVRTMQLSGTPDIAAIQVDLVSR